MPLPEQRIAVTPQSDDSLSGMELLGLTGSGITPSPASEWSIQNAPAPVTTSSLSLDTDLAPTQSGPLTRRAARALESDRGESVATSASSPAAVSRRRSAPRSAKRNAISKRAPERSRTASTRPPRRPALPRRIARKVISLAAMLFAGALLVGVSVPVNALIPTTGSAAFAAATTGVSAQGPGQTIAVASDATAAIPSRDAFGVIDYAQIMRQKYGNVAVTFTPTTGAVRWPFPYPVPITDRWGYRVSPCLGCSSYHQGVDFTPGVGTPIYAIADGVVASHSDTYYGLGNNVVISHVINGTKIDSVYAHMLTGSSPLVPGAIVKVGDLVGLVGDTGASTGPHLHLEIHVNGVKVDPFAWLTANAVS